LWLIKINDNKNIKSIVLGGGCFWCLEAVYNQIDGLEVVSGYAGGITKNPTYEQVCSGTTGHAEVVKINYNPSIISLKTILEIFFEIHNPTTLNRQGNDIGTQYRSIILFSDEEELEIINEVINEVQKEWLTPIVSEVYKLDAFYEAENYHQKYFERNPNQRYCKFIINPKIIKFKKHILPKLEFTQNSI